MAGRRGNGEGSIVKRSDGRWCAAYVDKLAGLQLSTPSNPSCQILLTLSCPLLSTDIFRAEENHVKFMYGEGGGLCVLLDSGLKCLGSFD